MVAGNKLGRVLRRERPVGLKGARSDEGASHVADGPVTLRTAVGLPAEPSGAWAPLSRESGTRGGA